MRLLVLVVLVCAAVMAEGRRGRNKKERKERVWHVATAEEECGKSVQMNEGHPTDLCTEVDKEVCICSSKDETTWKYVCGKCSLKWNSEEKEEENKEGGEKKNKKKAIKENVNKRQKLRSKLKEKANKGSKHKKNEKQHNTHEEADPQIAALLNQTAST